MREAATGSIALETGGLMYRQNSLLHAMPWTQIILDRHNEVVSSPCP